LIIVHGGPTHQKYAEFQARTQYFTSRGFAVLEVNYRGSTGYGKEYWQALKGQWGVLDVEDIYQAANILSEKDLFDSERIALLGSSAGGFTVLRLLIKHPGVFKAGISLYGITNLLELFNNPPKFERFYNHWLIGDPDTDEAVYKSRSPLFSANKIRDPIAIFQGGKDPIVPQDQAEKIVKTLKSNETPFEYYLYPEEGHGFKKSENVSDFYRKSEAFLRKHLINDQYK
jgi:dipeptidyl aminopeptidase/acylaminoacyl peptidase